MPRKAIDHSAALLALLPATRPEIAKRLGITDKNAQRQITLLKSVNRIHSKSRMPNSRGPSLKLWEIGPSPARVLPRLIVAQTVPAHFNDVPQKHHLFALFG